MIDASFVKVAPSTYQKWNATLGIRTTVFFFKEDGKQMVTVRHEQPKALIADIIDLNVKQQNSHDGKYGSKLITQTSRLPLTVHRQIMQQCGYQPGYGYDEKKFRQILNDRDNYKLKTVSGTI